MDWEQERVQRFFTARDKIIGKDRIRQGIGTLSEKSVHAILKHYFAPDEDMHEIPIENYVADIYTGTEILEIQTRQFGKMRDKLDAFLPLYPVTIIYPIACKKWLSWIDPETGELSERRKSPAKGNMYQIFPELYQIKKYLNHPHLKIHLVLLEVEEYRMLDGYGKDKKKRSSKYDKVPLSIVDEMEIEGMKDYMQFIPYEMEEPFTVKMFAKAAHIPQGIAQITINILFFAQVISRVGKEGNAWLYVVNE